MSRTYDRIRIFTWHIHGTYLYYLSQGDFDIYIPITPDKKNRNIGKGETFPFGDNVIEVPAEEVRNLQFDCILFQTAANFLKDQFDLLSPAQQQLPRIYLEHDPPTIHPTNTQHFVKDPQVLLVHVTHFNRLMWDNNGLQTHVVEHGVPESLVPYNGNIEKGIVVINNLPTRGRLLGLDVFRKVSREVPLELIGMGAEEMGIGEILHPQIPSFIANYRFFFNPIRYTSFGLSVCEAMIQGLPVVGLATTEMPTVFSDGINGVIHTDLDYLVQRMKDLLNNKELAVMIGKEGQQTARKRFNMDRFIRDWQRTFNMAIHNHINYKNGSYDGNGRPYFLT